MGRKVFFTDLDKTLLNSDKKISPDTMSTLKEFTEAGNLVVPCTGRPTGSVWKSYNSLGLKDICPYVISYNGGEIINMHKKEILFRTHLTAEQIIESEKLARKYNIYSQTFTDTHIVTTKYTECTKRYQKYEYMPVIETNDILDTMAGDLPIKMLYIELSDFERLAQLEHALKHHFGDTANICYSDPIYLELLPNTSGKGNGLKNFCRLFNIPIEDTIAAGDEENDIPMVSSAALGIAMKNGIDEIKAVADIITPFDNDNDGLVPILRQIIEK
ncbi:MAG: Cof-type HAD-IIB family hydrolase [Lachnospiraceae bacterium]